MRPPAPVTLDVVARGAPSLQVHRPPALRCRRAMARPHSAVLNPCTRPCEDYPCRVDASRSKTRLNPRPGSRDRATPANQGRLSSWRAPPEHRTATLRAPMSYACHAHPFSPNRNPNGPLERRNGHPRRTSAASARRRRKASSAAPPPAPPNPLDRPIPNPRLGLDQPEVKTKR